MNEGIKQRLSGFPLLSRLVIFILLPLLLGCLLLYNHMKGNLPTDGLSELTVGVSAPVSIFRDEHGVPHIEAKTDNDAFFAVGYVHAQDRLWQLEVQRRLAQGRLSEIFGRPSVARDVWFRTLGLYEAAKTAWPALSPDAQASLTAYTAGINAGITAQTSLPPEFALLSVKPEPWTVYDSLAWIKMFALNLGGNFNSEMGRFLASQTLTAQEMPALFPDNAADAPITVRQANLPAATKSEQLALGRLLDFQRTELVDGSGLGRPGVGSNAWVVSGKLTGGAALLANDPHLNLQLPSIWYVLSVKGKTLNVAGMSMVGLPVVIFGHNDHIAWGGTNMMADAQDLYFEHLDPANPNHYEVVGNWEPFTTRSETIKVRADLPEFLHKQFSPVSVQVRSSRHGPIISDQFSVFEQPVALRWTALDPGDTSFEAFYRLNLAGNWDDFHRAMDLHVAPALNMVYADRDGNIGYLAAGHVPIRKKGDGTLPSPGWNDDYAWSGYIPAAQMPQTYNPESGYIVTANNRIVDQKYPFFISADWASPARALRIEQMLLEKLRANKKLTLTDMQQMQADTVDLEAARMLPALLTLTPANDEQRQALMWLKDWQGDMSKDSQAAAIFNVWMRHFRQSLFQARYKEDWNKPDHAAIVRSFRDQIRTETLRQIVSSKDTPWCRGDSKNGESPCSNLLRDSLQSALDEVFELKGDHSMKSWHWGALQSSVYLHTPFSRIKPFDKFFERRVGSGGSENTINVAASEFEEKRGYLQHLGAGFRQVMQLDNKELLTAYMNSTGESGNLLSSHYDDMIEPFADAKYYRLETATKSKETE